MPPDDDGSIPTSPTDILARMQPGARAVRLSWWMRSSTTDREFHAFFAQEAEGLRRLAVYLTGDAERGADLAQDALARVYRHWGRIRSADPGPYARRILVNLVRSAHRRHLVERRHRETQLPPSIVNDAAAQRIDEFMVLSAALKQLPPVRRAAIVMRFYEDKSEAEIARILERPHGTINSDIHRGLAKLRVLLQQVAEEV